MKKFNIYIVLVVLFGCTSTVKQQNVEQSNPPEKQTIINDSLFYQLGIKEFKFSDIRNVQFVKLNKVNNDLKDQLSECLDINTQTLNAYYYTNFKSVGEITAVIVLLTTMESKYFVLLTTSDGSNLLSCIQLTQDYCDLIDEHEDSEEIWCNTKRAFIDESGNLKLISVHSVEMDYGSYSTFQEDSITSTYQISSQGLNLLNRDSVRVER